MSGLNVGRRTFKTLDGVPIPLGEPWLESTPLRQVSSPAARRPFAFWSSFC